MRFFKNKPSTNNELEPKQENTQLPSNESIIEHISIGFFMVDQQWNITYANHCVENWMGKSKEEMLGYNVWDVFPDAVNTSFYTNCKKALDEQVTLEFEEYFGQTGQWLEVKVVPHNGGIIGYLMNVTDRKKYEQLVERLEDYDSLTQLPNRKSYIKKLDQTINEAKIQLDPFALIYLNIDRIKSINNTLGHMTGDQLIKQMAARLKETINENGFIAHLGGDEFSIIVDHRYSDRHSVEKLARSIILMVEQTPFHVEENDLHVTVSLGICFFPDDGQESQTLIRHAYTSLNHAKSKGRNKYEFFNSLMDIESFKKLSLRRNLRNAIEENQLELYYQPKVNPKTGQITSAEALIRWNHPEWGVLPPDDFIPLAEEMGLINPLSEWVLKSVCTQIHTWQTKQAPYVPISINVSSHQFKSQNFVDSVRNIIQTSQIERGMIEFEITETSLLENKDSVALIIAELKELGMRVSLDDFGTGYSTLAYLTQFQVDVLKIDRHFIRNITTDSSNVAVVKSIIRLAHGLGMGVVAEGVETTEQLSFLKQQECDEIQGYLFSKPVPVKKFNQLLAKVNLVPKEISSFEEFENRRQYFRVPFIFSLSSYMTIVKIADQNISIGNTEVLIEDLGAGGIRFLSHLNLAINEDIIYEFETEILNETFIASGYIVWKEEMGNGIYQYGLEFTLYESQRNQLFQLLNQLSLQMKKSPHIVSSKLVKMDKHSYLRNIVAPKSVQ